MPSRHKAEDNSSSNTSSDSSNSTRTSEPQLLDLERMGEEVATAAASSRKGSQAMQRT